MNVRFSVLIPAYNQCKYVRESIDSVLSQAFTDYEVFVIDDGSTDRTPEALESYGTRIKVIRQTNQGPEIARDKAAALAHGEYLVMLDHDDLFLPGAFATYDRIIRDFDSPPLIIGFMKSFADGAAPCETQAPGPAKVLRCRDYLSRRVPILSSNSRIVILKSLFDQVGGYRRNTPASFPSDAFNLLLKVGTYGPCIIVQEPQTVAYRLHESNTIRNLSAVAGGILGLARAEDQGRYPGGKARRWARYAIIGGVASTYALRFCWRGGQRRLALRLLLGTAPMVFAAVVKRSFRVFRKATRAMVVPER